MSLRFRALKVQISAGLIESLPISSSAANTILREAALLASPLHPTLDSKEQKISEQSNLILPRKKSENVHAAKIILNLDSCSGSNHSVTLNMSPKCP